MAGGGADQVTPLAQASCVGPLVPLSNHVSVETVGRDPGPLEEPIMKRLASILCAGLLVLSAASAFAISTSNVAEPIQKGAPTQVPGGWTDTGGETPATATLITSLPYTDSDNTCGRVQDYTASCGANAAPDLFYRYVPTSNQNGVTISLCGSSYDTVLYVLENNVEIACNDDFCGLQSELTVSFVAGRTYIIGVSGFSTNCGPYTLNISGVPVPCIPTCPAGTQVEGEPLCGPNYVDAFNGGCNSTPAVFSQVTCGVICGESGTYLFNSAQYRDTDWYTLPATYSGGSYSGLSDGFALRLFVLTPVCPTTVISTTTSPNCVPSSSLTIPAGASYLFAGPDVFTGVPCGQKYLVNITGNVPQPPCGVTATEPSTWGQIKNEYR